MQRAEIANKSLVLDLIEWVGEKPRAYDDVMNAWRTSCPRLSIWEDANELGFVRCARDGSSVLVTATAAGLAFLEAERPRR